MKINNSNNKNFEKKLWNPTIFKISIITIHAIGLIFLITGLVIGGINNRLIFDDKNIIIFDQPIDILTYLLIIFGAIIILSMLIYWFIYSRLQKMIVQEKHNNKYDKANWIKYRHMIDSEKVKGSQSRKTKKE